MARLALNTADGPLTGRVVAGWWRGVATDDGMVFPDGEADVIWTRGRLPWLAGPDTGPSPVDLPAGSAVVGVRLRHGVASAAFGESVDAFTDKRLPVDAFWGDRDVSRLVSDLSFAAHPNEVAAALIASIDAHVSEDWEPDHVVAHSVARLRAGSSLSEIPISSRQHRRRFTETVGYGPKMFERICRFERFVELLEASPDRGSLARLASTVGYYDQSHLAKDSAALAGCAPGQLLGRA